MSTGDHLQAKLASSRRNLLAELEGFDDARFAQVPPRGGWSAGLLVEHLAIVETAVQRGARKAMAEGTLAKRTWLDALKQLALYRSGFANLVRVRTPSRVAPGAALPRPQALARLTAVREETNAVLDELRGRDVSRLYMRHPFFGAMSIEAMLEWVAWHEERHRRQVVRLRRALGMS